MQGQQDVIVGTTLAFLILGLNFQKSLRKRRKRRTNEDALISYCSHCGKRAIKVSGAKLAESNKGVRAIKVSGAKLATWVGMLDSSEGRLKSFPVP